MYEDIIAAVATAWGEGGISIVRVSGQGSAALVGKIFSAKKSFEEQPPRYMALGTLRDRAGEPFDEVLAVRFEAHKSYTGEESAELHCHGGLLAAQRCVEELCAAGARLAQPGEFTRRAFINGRMNLAQAEAVAGIIRARSDEALSASARTLQGGFTALIKAFMDSLLLFGAALETDLDFPEEGEGYLSHEEKKMRLSALRGELTALLGSCRNGLLLREGIRAAILGSPNVGKSSLLNALLGENRAIVTARPGTTRDSIEETFVYKGLPVRIIDTAGLRETEDEVEAIGVDRSLKAAETADILLWLFDGSRSPVESEYQLLQQLPASKPKLIVLNKEDLPQLTELSELAAEFPGVQILPVSALQGRGMELIKEAIYEAFAGSGSLDGSFAVSSRQLEALSAAQEALERAASALEASAGDDIVISQTSEAQRELASLLGTDASEELLDRVFSSFCVGK